MLAKDCRRLLLFIGTLLVLFLLCFRLLRDDAGLKAHVADWIDHKFTAQAPDGPQEVLNAPAPSLSNLSDIAKTSKNGHGPSTGEGGGAVTTWPGNNDVGLDSKDPAVTHHKIFSLSTSNMEYFPIIFADKSAANPNIIPHPQLENTWIVVAQRMVPLDAPRDNVFEELVCDAVFVDDALQCIEPPTVLPVAPTISPPGACAGDLGFFAFNKGPHDARVFLGPRTPYAVYGSNSGLTCFGMWMQDLRALVGWGGGTDKADLAAPDGRPLPFVAATELQRPPPYGAIEKNWFIFFDRDEALYVHHDISAGGGGGGGGGDVGNSPPRRVFAKLNFDGSVGQDLAPLAAAAGDEACMRRYMPAVAPEHESVHQATNSLSITLCRHADAQCRETADNTFVFTVFQHKSFRNFHSEYEPYVMLFRQEAPFGVHGMTKRPFWIHGRSGEVERGDSAMFYVTSISWKAQAQRYHGYLDDVLFVAFGIEDKKSGGIDVLASDLLEGLGLCAEA